MADRRGNAAKRLAAMPAPPWFKWRTQDRGERCIRFITSYCRPGKGHGAGELLRLAPFQEQFIRGIYGPGVRAGAMSVARGNGKSTLEAAISLHALFDADPEGGAPQVPLIATRLHQIERAVYDVALAIIENEPELRERALIYSGIGTRRIRTPHNGGELFPVSRDLAGLKGLRPGSKVSESPALESPNPSRARSPDDCLRASCKADRFAVRAGGSLRPVR